MKKLFFTILCCASLAFYGQTSQPDVDALMRLPGANFFDIKREMDAYFEQNPHDTEDEDGPFRSYQKWIKMWEGRISNGSKPQENGSFKHVIEAFQTTVNNPICTNVGSSNWQNLGLDNLSIHNKGRVDCVYPDPNNPKKVYVGTLNSGLWVTNDITLPNVHWTNLTDATRWAGMGVTDMLINPNNSNEIYIATGAKYFYTFGYGIGIVKSIDGGITWSQTGLTFPIENNYDHGTVVNKLIMDPTNPSRILALTEKEVYETTDGANSWVSLGLNSLFVIGDKVYDMEINPLDVSKIFVSGNKLWLYSSGMWTDATSSLSNTPNTAYPIKISKSGGDVYFMYKGGNWRIDKFSLVTGWNNMSSTSQNFTNSIFEVSAINPNIIYNELSSRLLAKSLNGGISWTPVTNYDPNNLYLGLYSTHADIRSFYIISGSTDGLSDKILCGSDGGVLYSELSYMVGTSNRVNWINGNGDINLTQVWGITSKSLPTQKIIAGAQDAGVFVWDDEQSLWKNEILNACIGDAYDGIIDPNNSNRFIVETNSSPMTESNNNGLNWNCGVLRPNFQPGNWGTSLPIEKSNLNKIYIGTDELFNLLPSGSWSNISNFPSSGLNMPACRTISAIAPAPSQPNMLYLGFSAATWNFDLAACPSTCPYPVSCPVCPGTGACLEKKLYIVENLTGIPVYRDITPFMAVANGGSDAVRGAGISGIAVNPANAFEMWISLNEFWNDGLGGGINRVVHMISSDGGISWIEHDYSEGLREFPVNCIKYDELSKNLYIGTDVGVFYRNVSNPSSVWECFNNNLPVVIVTDIEINQCKGTIIAATYGRGIWESQLAPAPAQSLTTTVLNTPTTFPSDVIISTGSTVTISSLVSMRKDKKIIVERGATLIIDGGKITNACGKMWQGIEVWGDVTKSQLTPGAQGKLIMKNGAIIENAIVAVSNLRKTATGYDPLYGGGIIQASNSQFINCGQSVNMMFYNNFHPTTNALLNDLSFFRDCKFIVNSSLADPTISPDKMVNLYNTIGVKFLGCEFKNITPVKGIAIWSIDSKYTVDDFCLNPLCTSVKRNVFEGHKYGIYSSNSNPLLAAKINHAIFNNNTKDGVHIAGMNYATVTNNDFEVNGALGAIASGLYLDNCKYYSVQNNNFTSTATYSSVGIYVKDSKNGAHELYKNKFTNLNVGIMPLQNNSGVANYADGLTMHCNDFISNSFDIAISSPTSSAPSSIAWVQGVQAPDASGLPGSIDPKKLVRNIYSAPCAGLATENKYYIKNSTYSNKSVFHASNQQAFTQPLPQPQCSDLNVNVVPTSMVLNYSAHCPDNTTLINSVLSAKIVQLGNDVTAQKAALSNLIDGGNTNTLLNAINSNMSPGNLKNLLMSKSPYLSDEVLIAYITKVNTPPNGHLKEVIVANSPVTVQVKVKIDALNLPNGIKQQIDAAQTSISARQSKEAQIIQTAYEKELTISDKIRYFINDTSETNPVDSIIAILKQYPRSENSCEVVGAYITKGDLVKAQAVVDSLEAINQLDDFCKFQKVIIELNQTLEKCYKMQTDVPLKEAIEAVANDCSKDGCCNAQALLKQVFNYQYDELRMLPEEERSMLAFEEQNDESVNGLKVYPNPANNELNFVFSSNETETAIVELRDVTGRLLETLQIKNGTTVQLNVSTYENAIYLLSLNINGKFVENRKLVIVK